MTEHALDPAESAGQESSSESRPRPRRRRRGGRGRGRGGAQATASRSTEQEQRDTTSAEASPPSGGEAGTTPAAGDKPQEAGAKGTAGSGGRRRSRGSRGRGRGGSRSTQAKTAADTGDAPTKGDEARSEETAVRPEGAPKEQGSSRPRRAPRAQTRERAPEQTPEHPSQPDGETPAPRRRRRRRRPASAPANAEAVHAAEPMTEQGDGQPSGRGDRQPSGRGDGQPSGRRSARATAGPTRTSRTARRGAADRRRRQPEVPVIRRTEKTMLMTEDHGRLQIVVLEGRDLVEHYVSRGGTSSMVGNIYLGRVQNVLPGMEAAFVDVGRGRNAVLYAGEVSYDEDVDAGERRIESVLKPGQSVLVQVSKDPLKGKGARLTAQISVPGRYLVYVPDGGASGISRRLPEEERERLRKIIKQIRPSEAGVIVRTAAEGASEEELAADLDRLKKAWESIKRKSRRAKPPKVLYEEPELAERVVRDVFSPTEFQHIVTDSREVYDRVVSYLKDVAPDLLDRIQFHDGKLPLFEAFHVSEQIHKALERKVWLPSGGYLVIDRTEAMTVIDVNTGKAVGKTNLEQTVTATNLEAAREIPRQLRLRDIGGIIVIDFIDMMLASNRTKVVQDLKEELAHDKTRSQVFDITALGLLEMTRKKVSAGLLEAFSEPCPTCEGRGILLTHDT